MVEISRLRNMTNFWRILFIKKALLEKLPSVKNFSKYSCQESEGFFYSSSFGKTYFYKKRDFFLRFIMETEHTFSFRSAGCRNIHFKIFIFLKFHFKI